MLIRTLDNIRHLGWHATLQLTILVSCDPCRNCTYDLQFRRLLLLSAELKGLIIYCFTSVVQQTKRHSSRELLGGFSIRRTTNFLKPVDDVLVHHRPPSLSRLYLAKSPSHQAKVRSAMHNCERLLILIFEQAVGFEPLLWQDCHMFFH